MGLTPEQKLAGRAFRDARQHALDVLNAASPPGRYALAFWRVVRHECRAAGGVSVGITLRERYELSPEYRACYCGTVAPLDPGYFPHRDCDGGKVISPAGQFAWIWKEGKCSGCELVVRTRKGFFVPCAADRLPDRRRTHDGRPAGPHPGDPRLPRA